MQVQPHRPLGITILAILAGVAFIVNGFVTLVFVGAIPVTILGGTGFFGQALLGAFFWGILALIWAWVAAGLWSLNPQAWTFVVVLSILNLILAVVSLIGNTSWVEVLPSITINGVILIYSLSPGVKEAFRIPGQQP